MDIEVFTRNGKSIAVEIQKNDERAARKLASRVLADSKASPRAANPTGYSIEPTDEEFDHLLKFGWCEID